MMPRVASISDHAQAKREAAIQRDRVADDLGEKAIARIAGAKWNRYPVSVRALFSTHKLARSQFAGAFSARTVYSLSGLRGLALRKACGGSERRVAVAHC